MKNAGAMADFIFSLVRDEEWRELRKILKDPKRIAGMEYEFQDNLFQLMLELFVN